MTWLNSLPSKNEPTTASGYEQLDNQGLASVAAFASVAHPAPTSIAMKVGGLVYCALRG